MFDMSVLIIAMLKGIMKLSVRTVSLYYSAISI